VGQFTKYITGEADEPPERPAARQDTLIPPQSYEDYLSTGQTARDFLRAGANSAMFGNYDRAAAAGNVLLGNAGNYDEAATEQFGKTAAARERSPWASIGGDFAGAAAMPGFGGGALAARLGGGALARFTGYGLGGAAQGAAQGAGSTHTGNPEDYAKNAAMGAVLGVGTSGPYGAAFGPRGLVSRAAVPTPRENYGAADMAYSALRGNPAIFNAGHLRARADTLENDMITRGLDTSHTDIQRALDRMRTAVTPGDLETAVQIVNNISRHPDSAAARKMGGEIKRSINDLYISPPPGAVHPASPSGAVDAAGEMASLARASTAVGKRQELIGDTIEAARNAATKPGARSEAEITQDMFRGLIDPRKKVDPLYGFPRDERQAVSDVVHNRTANTLRGVGKGMGGDLPLALTSGIAGGGAGATAAYFGVDPATAGALGAAVPIAGRGLRMAGNRSLMNSIREAEETIGRKSPLFQYRAGTAPITPGPAPVPLLGRDTPRNFITEEIIRQEERKRNNPATGGYQ
jgi:hypothetical protein